MSTTAARRKKPAGEDRERYELLKGMLEDRRREIQDKLRSLRETEGLPEADALKVELQIGQPIFATEDAREGPTAFAQKRKPDFKGR